MPPIHTDLIIALATSTAIFSFIQFLIKRRDEKKGVLKWIKEEVKKLRIDFDHDKADGARRRILNASEDIRNNQTRHSKEWWDQINLDIDRYEHFCKHHEDYENNRAVMAINNLKRIYQGLLEKGKDAFTDE